MLLEKLPTPLQKLIRRLVLSIRIPINQSLSTYRHWSRKWHRWRTSDPTRWHVIDFSKQPPTRARTFCISLLEDSRFDARRQLFRRYAKKYGWPVEFWPAVNGTRFQTEDFPEWIKERNSSEKRPFSAGAVGLLMTTREIFQWAEAQELEHLVIFEDDGVIHASPKVELPEEFDIVFLNNRVQGDKKGLVKHGWGTDGYVISRRGIRKMLDIFENVNADIDMLIMMYTKSLGDRGHYMTRHRDSSKAQLDCYHVGPLVTHAGHFESSIGIVTKQVRET